MPLSGKQELSGGSPLLRSLLVKAILEYNKYHSPEASASISKMSNEVFTLQFHGPFCQSCGIRDYFDDFVYDLESVCKYTASIVKVTEAGEDCYVVEFSNIMPNA